MRFASNATVLTYDHILFCTSYKIQVVLYKHKNLFGCTFMCNSFLYIVCNRTLNLIVWLSKSNAVYIKKNKNTLLKHF